MSQPLENYAFIGDFNTGALVSRDGSIDWLCLPNFDSDACFAALLGRPEHGRWLITPVGPATSTWEYVEGSLVLQTTHHTETGVVRVTDWMPPGDHRADVARMVEGLEGTVRMRQEWVIRGGYGAVVPWVRRLRPFEPAGSDPAGSDSADSDPDQQPAIVAIAGPDQWVLRGDELPQGRHHLRESSDLARDRRHLGEFEVSAGDRLWFDLAWRRSWRDLPEAADLPTELERTVSESREWLEGLTYDGPYREAVATSVLVLRALTHRETGGIVAAPTTSLPEDLGGERNWDYRYTWLRDAALTVEALLVSGFADKTVAWRDWLLRAIAGNPADLQIMYRLDGGRELPERELDFLPGYADSRPVRIGNGAVGQRQLDVLGEVMIALDLLREYGITETRPSWDLQCTLIDDLVEHWQEPDQGLWEMRGPARHFTHSRVMVWVALDRAVRAIDEHGFDGPREEWAAARDQVRAVVEREGFNAEINSFTQHCETTAVDASLLLLATVGFVAPDDPRFVGTVERIQQELVQDGMVLRYLTHDLTHDAEAESSQAVVDGPGVDGLGGTEHPFLICNFWLVCALAQIGRLHEATELMDRLLAARNDLGLLAEEYDPSTGRLIGNFPQAFSHLGLIQAAVTLQQFS